MGIESKDLHFDVAVKRVSLSYRTKVIMVTIQHPNIRHPRMILSGIHCAYSTWIPPGLKRTGAGFLTVRE